MFIHNMFAHLHKIIIVCAALTACCESMTINGQVINFSTLPTLDITYQQDAETHASIGLIVDGNSITIQNYSGDAISYKEIADLYERIKEDAELIPTLWDQAFNTIPFAGPLDFSHEYLCERTFLLESYDRIHATNSVFSQACTDVPIVLTAPEFSFATLFTETRQPVILHPGCNAESHILSIRIDSSPEIERNYSISMNGCLNFKKKIPGHPVNTRPFLIWGAKTIVITLKNPDYGK